MCDAFLVLAQTAARARPASSCRAGCPTARATRFHLQRLKDKLGNRSNASSEIEFDGAWARLVGEEGRGVPTIIEMVNHTRLDCVIGSAALMRAALAQALHHAAHRAAFGKLLDRSAADAQRARRSGARVRGGDRGDDAPGAAPTTTRRGRRAFRAAGHGGAKYWICKRAPVARRRGAGVPGRQRLRRGVGDAAALPRGAAQLDLGRLGQRHVPRRAARDAARAPSRSTPVLRDLGGAGGRSPAGHLRQRAPGRAREDRRTWRCGPAAWSSAWRWPCRPRCWCATPRAEVADAFCASRLAGDGGRAFGTLPAGVDFRATDYQGSDSGAAVLSRVLNTRSAGTSVSRPKIPHPEPRHQLPLLDVRKGLGHGAEIEQLGGPQHSPAAQPGLPGSAVAELGDRAQGGGREEAGGRQGEAATGSDGEVHLDEPVALDDHPLGAVRSAARPRTRRCASGSPSSPGRRRRSLRSRRRSG